MICKKLITLAAIICCGPPAQAQPVVYFRHVRAGTWRDVDIQGTQVLVGARDDELGEHAGAAMLYDFVTGMVVRKLHASDAVPLDSFGRRVALNGDKAAIATVGNVQTGRDGAVYIFDIDTGEELLKVEGPDPENASPVGFAWTMDMAGNYVVAGDSRIKNDNGDDVGGAFVISVETGEVLHSLFPFDGNGNDVFSQSVAAHGAMVLVGSQNVDPGYPFTFGSGAGYLYDGETGELIRTLRPDLLNSSAGWAVDLNAKFAALTAPSGAREPTAGASGRGTAILVDLNTGEIVRRFLPEEDVENDIFGYDVAMDDRYVVIGAVEPEAGSGAAYIFDIETGEQIAKLTPSEHPLGGNFGDAVAIDDGLVAVLKSGVSLSEPGAAYFYEIIDSAPGDADRDSDIDTADLSILTAHWTGAMPKGGEGRLFRQGDFDLDDDVDTADLNQLLVGWTGAQAEPGEVAGVPEPGTGACVGACMLLIAWVRRFVVQRRSPHMRLS